MTESQIAQAWNLGVLTKKVSNVYEPLSRAEQQRNIAHLIDVNDEHYARYAVETYDCALLQVAGGATMKKFQERVQTSLGI